MTILNLKQAYCKLDKDQRFYQLDRPIIGLTGGIATGKSSASNYLRSKGYPIIDADGLVKKIYQKAETIKFIKSIKDSYIQYSQVDFKELRKDVFNSLDLKNKIEEYIYAQLPSVFEQEISTKTDQGAIIYDIPLLFEKSLQDQFDLIICIYAPRDVQKSRLISRDGISEELTDNILSQQMDIETKAQKADFTIDNTNDIENLERELDKILELISE